MDAGLVEEDFWVRKSILDVDGHYFGLVKKKIIHDVYFDLPSFQRIRLIETFLKREELIPISEVVNLVQEFRLAGYKILVTTASLDFLVIRLLENMSFLYDFLHCSSFELTSSVRVITKLNNTGVTKLQCLKDLLNLIGEPKKTVVFSDHFSDLPILMFGSDSFIVRDRRNLVDDWSGYFNFKVIEHCG